MLTQAGLKPLFGLQKGPTGVFKSVLDTTRTDGKRRDEIFVDVVERLSMTFGPGGNIVSAQVDGAIQVRVLLVCAANTDAALQLVSSTRPRGTHIVACGRLRRSDHLYTCQCAHC